MCLCSEGPNPKPWGWHVAPVDVSIHSPHLVGGGVVKFTTDGGEPGELGHVFTRPFAVDTSDEAVVTIKAVVLGLARVS